MPEPRLAWARSRLARGDAAGALALAKAAAQRGPRWADPAKAQGDALMALGRHRDAAKAYERAVTLAPQWGGARLGWAAALAKVGKADAAVAQRRFASALDLTPTERAQLTGMSR